MTLLCNASVLPRMLAFLIPPITTFNGMLCPDASTAGYPCNRGKKKARSDPGFVSTKRWRYARDALRLVVAADLALMAK